MDDPLKHLRKYQTGGVGDVMHLAFPLPRSASGLVERHCPSEACAPRIFQLGDGPGAAQQLAPSAAARIRRGPGGDGTVCPYCGTVADDAAFLSPRDREAALDQLRWAATEGVREALGASLRDMTRRISSRNRGGMLSISATYKPGRPTPAPRPYREDLLRALTCDVCSRRYGVYAVGLFCPDCGATNVGVHFARELQLIRDQAALARAAADDGQAELAFRLLGNAHEDVLTAFETYLKTLYRFLVNKRTPDEAERLTSKKAIGNAFQNIRRATALYAALGIDPFAGRTAAETELLERNIQKRHVIGHNLGLADEAYVERLGETAPGRTVDVTPAEITTFAEVCAAVVQHIVAVSRELSHGGAAPRAEQLADGHHDVAG